MLHVQYFSVVLCLARLVEKEKELARVYLDEVS